MFRIYLKAVTHRIGVSIQRACLWLWWWCRHHRSDRSITRWAVRPPWDRCYRQGSAIPGGRSEARNMLVVPLPHHQAYYKFPHCHSFHGGELTIKAVAVRKLRGPTRPPGASGLWGCIEGGTWCAPCLHACPTPAWHGLNSPCRAVSCFGVPIVVPF